MLAKCRKYQVSVQPECKIRRFEWEAWGVAEEKLMAKYRTGGKVKKDIKDSIFWSISLHYDFYVSKY